MKHNTTFEEAGKVFAMVAKFENAVESYKEAAQLADKLGKQFDAEFEKYNYTFFIAPAELSAQFEAKCNSRDDEEKKLKAIRNHARKFVEMTGIGNGYREYWEDEILQFACKPYGFKVERILFDVKLVAKEFAKGIKF